MTHSVTDKATFDKGLVFSEGIEYVISGVIVVKNGKTVDNVFPGNLFTANSRDKSILIDNKKK